LRQVAWWVWPVAIGGLILFAGVARAAYLLMGLLIEALERYVAS
jgi:hypothetical protein